MKIKQKLFAAMRSIATYSLRLCAIAFTAVITFAMTACDNPAGPGSGVGTYTGTANGVTYTLQVADGTRTAAAPRAASAMTWTAVSNTTFGTSDIKGIAYGANKFVAVGEDGKMAYSSDGVSWTRVTNTTFGANRINAIAYGNGIFVAGGSNVVTEADKKIAYSSDGINWIAVPNTIFGTNGYINAIAYGGGRFVAGGSLGGRDGVTYSSDGVNWIAVQNRIFSSNSSVVGIAWSGSRFVAVGFGGLTAYSPDGISWTAGVEAFDRNANAIAYGGGKFVAVGNGGRMAYSPDGISWTPVANSTFGSSEVASIAYGGSRFVAGGNGGKTAYSSDGVSWAALTAVTNNAFPNWIGAIAYGGGRFVAGGHDGKMAYSTDGGSGSGGGGGNTARTYTLTASGKTSTGIVVSFTGGVFTLQPSYPGAPSFTVTISGARITAMSGITWDNGATESAPTFTPPSPGGGVSSSLVGTWVSDDYPMEMIIFSNGRVEVSAYGTLLETATITTSGNRWTINSPSAGIRTGTFSISGSRLTWTEDGTSAVTFTRQGSTGGGGGGNNPNPGTGGTFTLTGIPSQYNGKYASLAASLGGDTLLYGAQSTTGGLTLPQISGGSVSIPMWTLDNSIYDYVRYSGNNTVSGVVITIWQGASASSQAVGGLVITSSVTFSNGSAARSWSAGVWVPN